MATRLILILSLFLSLGGSPAMAASFSCSAASTAFERTICADPELSRLDEQLAVGYATAIGGLTDGARADMLEGQRSWLNLAQRACTANAEPLAAPLSADGDLECLRGHYRERLADLEQSRMLSGLRFYAFQRYASYPDTTAEADSPWRVATHSLSTVRLDGRDEEANSFNSFVSERSADLGDGLGVVGGQVTEDAATSDSTASVRVATVTPSRISLNVDTYWFGHGAAHGNYSISHLHFLRGANRALVADDIFAGEGWQDALFDLASAAIKREHADGLIVDDLAPIRDTIVNPDYWSFDEGDGQGLVIQFQPYEITAYAYGAPTITIAWDALQPYLAENALELASGG